MKILACLLMMLKDRPHIICTVTNDLSFDRRMNRICETLATNGFQITLIGRKRSNATELKSHLSNGQAISYVQKRLKCWFSKGPLFYLEYNLRLFIYLLFQKNYHGICAVDVDTLWPAVAVGKLKNKKIIFDAHELFHEVPELIDRPTVQNIWKKIGAWLIPKVNMAYTVGPALAHYFSKLYQIPFHTIRNVPTKLPESIVYNANSNIILYQGKVNMGRGIREMILAMASIESYEFWILGDGDEYQDLKNWATQLPYSSRIKFFGFIEPEKLADFTRKAALGINLLENKGLSYYYSLANKAFDYVQSGIPSIQMAFPEYEKLQQQYQCFLLLEDLKASSIQELLARVEAEPNLLTELHQQAKIAAQTLNWEKEAPLLIQLYKDLFKIP